jgi:signal peptidase
LILGLTFGSSGIRNVFGYSIYTVLTDSMQREIPQGSLIVVRKTEPEDIQVGDDITFFMDRDTTKTHRVTRVFEDYEGSGERGFETQGLENPLPDPGIVYAANVVGRVIFHAAGVGDALAWIGNRWVPAAALLAGLIVLYGVLKILFAGGRGRRKPRESVRRTADLPP